MLWSTEVAVPLRHVCRMHAPSSRLATCVTPQAEITWMGEGTDQRRHEGVPRHNCSGARGYARGSKGRHAQATVPGGQPLADTFGLGVNRRRCPVHTPCGEPHGDHQIERCRVSCKFRCRALSPARKGESRPHCELGRSLT